MLNILSHAHIIMVMSCPTCYNKVFTVCPEAWGVLCLVIQMCMKSVAIHTEFNASLNYRYTLRCNILLSTTWMSCVRKKLISTSTQHRPIIFQALVRLLTSSLVPVHTVTKATVPGNTTGQDSPTSARQK